MLPPPSSTCRELFTRPGRRKGRWIEFLRPAGERRPEIPGGRNSTVSRKARRLFAVEWLRGPALDCGSDPTWTSYSSFGTECPTPARAALTRQLAASDHPRRRPRRAVGRSSRDHVVRSDTQPGVAAGPSRTPIPPPSSESSARDPWARALLSCAFYLLGPSCQR
jgi:hypothetical protein